VAGNAVRELLRQRLQGVADEPVDLVPGDVLGDGGAVILGLDGCPGLRRKLVTPPTA
jgi:hypothetical protein